MKRTLLLLINLVLLTSLYAQLRVGDPGVTFDQSKFDNRYPQMQEWKTAGVRGGIPFIEDLNIKKTLNDGANSDAINNAINSLGSAGGTILLKNGNYRIDKQVNMKSKVRILGESRGGVVCTIYMTGGNGFNFGTDVQFAGLYRLTIQGSWGEPQYAWNYSLSANDELPNNDNTSVRFRSAKDCWLDKITILNSARDPMRCPANHITFRDLVVDGCHRKAGGAQGYFFIQGAHNLITGCYITHLRHISLQGGGVEYNVVYDNDFEQEISYHSGDKGFNLIENNRITLPVDMPPVTSPGNNKPIYFAIMGPWSIQHEVSARPNYTLNNKCMQLNHDHGSKTPWSEPNIVYKGPIKIGKKPQDHIDNFPALPTSQTPIGNTFYPIILENNINDNLVFDPINDAYLQGENEINFNTIDLRVEANNRLSYLMFDLSAISENVHEAYLEITVGSDGGSGVINVYQVGSDWQEETIDGSNKPTKLDPEAVYSKDESYVVGEKYRFDVTTANYSNDLIAFVLEMENGNDVSFASKEHQSVAGPKLVVKESLVTDHVGAGSKIELNSLYPNPSIGSVTISGWHQGLDWSILDVYGNDMGRGSSSSIDVSGLSSGSYYITLSTGQMLRLFHKVD